MKRKEHKKNNEKTKLWYLFIVIISFTMAFVLLINKQKEDTYLADIEESSFNIKPEVGKTIVAKDEYAIYPKYYVVFVNNSNYTIYVYNYYDTISQYNLEFNRLISKIVDYNINDKMIRYMHSKGYGTYNEILKNLSVLVENENLKIY